MNLTILGASAACPAPGGACSAYLVQQGTTNLMLDCGPGSIANLRRALDFRSVTAVVLSHLHSDHILDLIPYRYAPGASGQRVPLWIPPDSAARLELLGQAVSGEARFFASTFEVREYDPDAGLTIDDLDLTFMLTQHYVPAWAIRCAAGDVSLVYTADSGPTASLVKIARDADLLLCEATLLEAPLDETTPGHLTAAQAGELAHAAGAHHLVLTHLWPELGLAALLSSAQAAFDGKIDIAHEGARFTIDRLVDAVTTGW